LAIAEHLKPTFDLPGEEPTAQDRALFEAAKQAARHADPMHSHFFVGAALRSKKRRRYTGANFENDSYGMTICAERAAIATAVAAEGHELEIVAIAVYAEHRRNPRTGKELLAAKAKESRTPSPCGACRQVIYQYGPRLGRDTHVIFPVRGVLRRFRMVDLLAVPFEL
jgi:cytidine deaminase